jgi:Cu2+-containing amine oxidase
LYASGVDSTSSTGEDGLSAWTQANPPIENTDIVAWYTVPLSSRPASRGLAGDAADVARLCHSAVRFFRRESGIEVTRETVKKRQQEIREVHEVE